MDSQSRAHRPRRGACRFSLATALSLAVVALLAPAAQAEPAPVASGTANWGVKESFRSYVENVPPGGTVTASDGATEAADGTFDFSAASGEIEADGTTGMLAFEGTVTFSKPAHAISITLEDPRLHLSGATGTLFASGTSQGNAYDTDIATLDLSGITAQVVGQEITLADIPATLTENGVTVFGGTYPAGTALDPVSFTVTATDAPVEPGEGTIKPGRAEQKAKKGTVKLATVRCTAACDVMAAKRVKARVKGGAHKGRAIRLKVDAPATLAAGDKAVVTAKLGRRAKRALKGGRAKLKTELRLSGGVETVTGTVKVKVAG